MAFPQVADTNTSVGSGTTHTVSLPANISVGNLLIVFVATDGNNTVTNWGGFTEIFSESNGTASSLHIAYKIAVGSDTCVVTTSESEESAHASYRITGHSTSQMPEASTGSFGTNDINPDPDELTPTGGAKDYLWIAAEGNDDDDTVASWPENFTGSNLEQVSGMPGGCNVGVGTRDLNASVLDPGTFTLDNAEQWVACTVAVYPVGGAPKSLSIKSSSHALDGTDHPALNISGFVDGVDSQLGLDGTDHPGIEPGRVLVIRNSVLNQITNTFALGGDEAIWVDSDAYQFIDDEVDFVPQHINLEVLNSIISQEGGHPTLSTGVGGEQTLTPRDSEHGLTRSAFALSSGNLLTIADSEHDLDGSDHPALSESEYIIVQSTRHGFDGSDHPQLSESQYLYIKDSQHDIDGSDHSALNLNKSLLSRSAEQVCYQEVPSTILMVPIIRYLMLVVKRV